MSKSNNSAGGWLGRGGGLRPESFVLVLAVVPVILGILLAFGKRWVCDDAFISFRYAENLIHGLGLVYNAGERVEGYTNFLWTMWAALGLRFGADGTPVGMWVMVRDITERKRAEEALQSERNILHTIMENTRAHLAYLDRDFSFVTVNSAYAEGAGYSREQLIGRGHFELFPDAANQEVFEQVRDSGESIEFHARPFEFPDRPDPVVRWVAPPAVL